MVGLEEEEELYIRDVDLSWKVGPSWEDSTTQHSKTEDKAAMATSMRGKLPASQKSLVYSAAVIPLVLYLLRNRLSTMRPKAMTPLNTPALLASVKEFFVETEKGRELLIAE